MASADRRLAARRIYERTEAHTDWIAALWGVEPGWLTQLVAREGWSRGEADPRTTIDRLMRHVSAQLAAFEADAGEGSEGKGSGGSGSGGGKARLDALLAITRTFDKLAEMRRAEDERRGGEGDERALARARDLVERRVGELAGQRAETMIEHLAATKEG